jgi:hypothetical protein
MNRGQTVWGSICGYFQSKFENIVAILLVHFKLYSEDEYSETALSSSVSKIHNSRYELGLAVRLRTVRLYRPPTRSLVLGSVSRSGLAKSRASPAGRSAR